MPRNTRRATRPQTGAAYPKSQRKTTVTGDPVGGFTLSSRASRKQAAVNKAGEKGRKKKKKRRK